MFVDDPEVLIYTILPDDFRCGLNSMIQKTHYGQEMQMSKNTPVE